MGIINILALGSPGTGKTKSIVNLANHYKKSNYYSYESETDYLNYATLTPYEFVIQLEQSITIKIFEFGGQIHLKQLKVVLRNLNIPFHGVMLFLDGLGFYLSSEAVMIYLSEIFSLLNNKGHLLFGLINTKCDLRDILQEKFFINNIKYILTKDLIQNREDFFLSKMDSKYKKFSVTTYQDNLTLFHFSQIEQLLVNLIERRILFIPKYKPFSDILIRYFVRNLLGTELLKEYNLSGSEKTDFLIQIFKSAPTALENDSSFQNMLFEYVQQPEDVIPTIWQLPLNIDHLRNNFDKLIKLQLCTSKKLIKVSENISRLIKKYIKDFDIDLFTITSTSRSEKNILKRFIDNIIIINEHKTEQKKKPRILTWKSLGLDKF
ncbi:MAG: hypothetical protein ACW981_14475 [Candidatus Hodarchaeales archaeon]|jgi:hypothetical protein